MKKILFLLATALTSLFLLMSCGEEKYEPVESTVEEARVVMTLELDDEKYEIKYELYKMLFMNNHSLVDGGDTSVWSGADKDAYISEMNELILSRATEIYSVLHLAKKSGIDPYSKKIENQIYENIRISVEGNGSDVTGHGSYAKYLESLSERHMNYAVAELLLRYSIVYNEITQLFAGEEHEVLGQLAGALEYTKEDVKAYYDGADSARILHFFFATEVKSLAQMNAYRAALDECENATDAAVYIMNTYSPVLDTDIFVGTSVSGIMVGKYELDRSKYSDYTDAALSLLPGEVSDVVTVTQDKDYYYVIYKLEKTDDYFNSYYDRVEASYIDHTIGEFLFEAKTGLTNSCKLSGGYAYVNHSEMLKASANEK